MAVFLGAIKKDIFAAFYYINNSDRINQDWGIKDVGSTLYEISKKANTRLENGKYKYADIKIYDFNTKKFKLISTKKF